MDPIISRLEPIFGSFPEAVIYLSGGRAAYSNEPGSLLLQSCPADLLFAMAEHPGGSMEIALGQDLYRVTVSPFDGGELLVLAPGIARFGEDMQNDAIIRKYGYCGRLKTLELFSDPQNTDLRENMGVAAHLIHGSSDGRFTITYAVKDISQDEIRKVHFNAASYDEMVKRYDPAKLSYGWNTLPDGEEIYFIPNPALGLWIDRTRF